MTEETEQTKPEKPKPNYYIDNAEFYAEMTEWVKLCEDAFEKGESRPQLNDAISKKIMLLCEGMSHRYNFGNYTFRDEFVLDGIENCIRYAHNFDYVKYKSPLLIL